MGHTAPETRAFAGARLQPSDLPNGGDALGSPIGHEPVDCSSAGYRTTMTDPLRGVSVSDWAISQRSQPS